MKYLGCLFLISAIGLAATEETRMKLDNPLFPFCVTVPENTLKELGFTPLPSVWPAINVDKTPAYDAALTAQIKSLKGTNTVLWINIHGAKNGDKDEKAVAALRELADLAEANGVRFSIYPHTGFYADTTRDALRIVKKVDRKNVGLTFNLCHELMTDGMDALPETIKEAAPYLFIVTINGADRKEHGQKAGWDKLIQPLGQGTFDVYGFLRMLKVTGYNGPIGLQCYGLQGALGGKQGDPLPHLRQSAQAWKQYADRMAAEQDGVSKEGK